MYTAASYVNQAPRTFIIIHHIWKYRVHLSYQAKNEVVRPCEKWESFVIPWRLKGGGGSFLRSLYI